MKKIITIFLLLLFIPFVKANSIGIGVEPSIVNVELSSVDPVKVVEFKIWNEGDTDTNFTIIPAQLLKNFTDFEEKTYFVPANTTRLGNYTSFKMLFVKKTYGDKELETGFYIRAEVPSNATIGVTPQIFVKTRIKQVEDGKYALKQVKQAYRESLGENYSNFTWWSSLWGETTLKAEHPNITEKKTEVKKEEGFQFDLWLVVVIFIVILIGVGFFVLKIYAF